MVPLFFEIAGRRGQWSSGSGEMMLEHDSDRGLLPIAVRCRFGSLEPELAMLDTGAHHTILSGDVVEEIVDELGDRLEPVRISTRRGTFDGYLHRVSIKLVAEEGRELQIDATCAVLKDWPGPSILGFRGFAERLRIGLDPGQDVMAQPTWFFGAETEVAP